MASVAWIGFGAYDEVEREKNGKWCLYNGAEYVHPHNTKEQALHDAWVTGNCGHVALMKYLGGESVPVAIVEV